MPQVFCRRPWQKRKSSHTHTHTKLSFCRCFNSCQIPAALWEWTLVRLGLVLATLLWIVTFSQRRLGLGTRQKMTSETSTGKHSQRPQRQELRKRTEKEDFRSAICFMTDVPSTRAKERWVPLWQCSFLSVFASCLIVETRKHRNVYQMAHLINVTEEVSCFVLTTNFHDLPLINNDILKRWSMIHAMLVSLPARVSLNNSRCGVGSASFTAKESNENDDEIRLWIKFVA